VRRYDNGLTIRESYLSQPDLLSVTIDFGLGHASVIRTLLLVINEYGLCHASVLLILLALETAAAFVIPQSYVPFCPSSKNLAFVMPKSGVSFSLEKQPRPVSYHCHARLYVLNPIRFALAPPVTGELGQRGRAIDQRLKIQSWGSSFTVPFQICNWSSVLSSSVSV